MFGSLAVGAFASNQDWNLTGNWKLDYSLDGVNYDTNLYDVTLSQTAGTLTGTGQYPDPGPYSYAWDVAGSINGNTFTLTDTYTLGAVGTVMHMTGTVATDGTISGTWDDNYGGGRTGTWKTISGVAVPVCTQTGFFRDSINMTAALINPSGTVTGDVNATGCNIGVYYDNGNGIVDNANVFGSNYFGVLVNGDTNNVSVNVTNSKIHNIGEKPFNGIQHGVAVYYRSFDNGGSVTGQVSGNTVSSYQKGGITANGNAVVDVLNNTVTGNGFVDYIAQNGVQYGWGATGHVQDNTITEHSYSGSNLAADGGVLVVGGPCYGSGGAYTKNLQIIKNTLSNNDVGVYLSNVQADCISAPKIMTNIKVVNNTISNDQTTNTTGYGATQGYQAGISDQGNNDKLVNNKITGIGYNSLSTTLYSVPIDASASFTTNAKIHANKFL